VNGEGWSDARIAEALEVGTATVERVRKRFVTQGLEAAAERRPQPPRPQQRRLDGSGEAHLVALACSKPPEGHDRWTLDLLADRMVKLRYVSTVSRDTVRRVLKKTSLSLG
jgi:transposase